MLLAGVMIVLFIITPFTQRKGSAVERVKNDLVLWIYRVVKRSWQLILKINHCLSAVEDTYDELSCYHERIFRRSSYMRLNSIHLISCHIMSFLSEFDVMDIQSAVRMLYSIGDLDRDSMNQTINALVRRNYELSDKAEAARYLDSTSMMRFSEYIPTFFVAFKMAVDMMLSC